MPVSPMPPRMAGAALRVAGGVALMYASTLFDTGWEDVVAGLVWIVGLVLIWSGLGRLVPAVLPRDVRRWFEGARADDWEGLHPDLLEPGDFEVVLGAVGNRPISVVRIVRDLTGFPLGQAKALTESHGSVVVSGRSDASCRRIVASLERVGATATVRPTAG